MLLSSCIDPTAAWRHPDKLVQVNVANFIADCKAGNGSTNEDIKYVGHIDVSVNNGGRLDNFSSQPFTSPSTAIKDPLVIADVSIPTDVPFQINVYIDGQECSLCQRAYCNAYDIMKVDPATGANEKYQTNNGYAYWTAEKIYTPAEVAGVNSLLIPFAAVTIRNPNGSQNCSCEIKY